MDMFFAAVEEYDDPSLKEKIFAVGSTGMLCTSNYKARKYGIRAGMPGFVGEALAKRLAKDTLILVPPRHGRYKEFSLKAEEVFSQYDPNYAMMSLDEAYMDFTEHLEARLTMTDEQKTFNGVLYDNDIDSAVKEMRQRVFLATGLTCSAGYGANTLVSKIASDMNKPNGQFAVAFDEASVNEFLRPLPLRKIPGIGKRLDLLLKTALDVNTVGDLVDKKHLVPFLFDDEKSSNGFLAGVIAGYGNTFVPQSGPRKSRGKETSIKPTSDTEILLGILHELSDDLGKHCKDAGVLGAGFTLKVKTDQFVLFTRSKVLPRAINDGEEIFKFAEKMFMKEFADGRKYRLLGVALKDFDNKKNNRKITSFFEAPARADERTPKTEQVSWTKTSPEPEIIKRSPLKDRKTKSSFWNKSKNTNPTTVKGENEQEKTTKRNLTAEICEEKYSSSREINLLDFSDDSNSRGPIYSNKGCPSFWNRNISEEPAADLVEQTGPSRAVEIEYVSDDSRSSTISNASSINSLGPFMKRTTMSKNVPPPLIEEYRKMGAESLQSRLEDIICPEELEEIRNFQNQRPAPKIHRKPFQKPFFRPISSIF